MSDRRFTDREGNRWQVRVSSKTDWRFDPVPGNPNAPRTVQPPLYAGDDPYELSEEELQTILGNARELGPPKLSPFRDDYEAPKKKSPFLDDQ